MATCCAYPLASSSDAQPCTPPANKRYKVQTAAAKGVDDACTVPSGQTPQALPMLSESCKSFGVLHEEVPRMPQLFQHVAGVQVMCRGVEVMPGVCHARGFVDAFHMIRSVSDAHRVLYGVDESGVTGVRECHQEKEPAEAITPLARG